MPMKVHKRVQVTNLHTGKNRLIINLSKFTQTLGATEDCS